MFLGRIIFFGGGGRRRGRGRMISKSRRERW
jgi:hypothetical protein